MARTTIGHRLSRAALLLCCAATASAHQTEAPTSVELRAAVLEARSSTGDELPAELEVERAPPGLLLVRPRIDGKHAGWFILDTGAGTSMIDRAAREALGGERRGEIGVAGVGAEVRSAVWRFESLELGPLTHHRPTLVDVDLSLLEQPMGRPIAGILGFEVFARAVVEMDFDAPRVALHDPRTYTGENSLTWHPLSLFGRQPCIEGKLEGHPACLRIDTGSDTPVDVHAGAIARWDLLEGRATTSDVTGGIGGSLEHLVGRLARVAFAGRVFEDVQAGFQAEVEGFFDAPGLDANLGTPLLKDCEVVFDYAARRMALRVQ